MPDETVECTIIAFRKLSLQPAYRIVYAIDDKDDSVFIAHYPYTQEGLRWALSILRVARKSQVPVILNIDPTTTPPTIRRIRLPVIGTLFGGGVTLASTMR